MKRVRIGQSMSECVFWMWDRIGAGVAGVWGYDME